MGKKAKIIIIILSLLVVGLVAFIVTDKFIINRDREETGKISNKNSASNAAENNTNREENKISEEKNKDEEKLTPTTVEPDQTEAVKKALKDKEWLADNVLVQDDENYSDGEVGTQVVNFIVCKSNDKIPIVVIQVSAEDIRYSKIMLVTYSESEGKVTAEKINEGHIYHGAYAVDANKCVVSSLYMHGGAEAMIYHSVANGKLKFMGEYGISYEYENGEEKTRYLINKKSMSEESEDVSEEEYEEYKASLNESQYNFVEIGTELTNSNVDKYIK